jgi:hypothetical protein
MQGTLGILYKFFYQSLNNVEGLEDIYAKVLKPDGSILGSYPLTEMSDADFASIYYFDINLGIEEAEGEYIIAVIEPTSGFKKHSKITFKKQTALSDAEKAGIIDELAFRMNIMSR